MSNAGAEGREGEHDSEGEPAEQEGQHDESDHHVGSKQKGVKEWPVIEGQPKDGQNS